MQKYNKTIYSLSEDKYNKTIYGLPEVKYNTTIYGLLEDKSRELRRNRKELTATVPDPGEMTDLNV